jgi:hypothetical protein
MNLIRAFCYIAGVSALAYGAHAIYAPLAPITIGAFLVFEALSFRRSGE